MALSFNYCRHCEYRDYTMLGNRYIDDNGVGHHEERLYLWCRKRKMFLKHINEDEPNLAECEYYKKSERTDIFDT